MSTTLFIIINPITSKITLIRSKIFPITVLNSGLAYTGFIILIKTSKITELLKDTLTEKHNLTLN